LLAVVPALADLVPDEDVVAHGDHGVDGGPAPVQESAQVVAVGLLVARARGVLDPLVAELLTVVDQPRPRLRLEQVDDPGDVAPEPVDHEALEDLRRTVPGAAEEAPAAAVLLLLGLLAALAVTVVGRLYVVGGLGLLVVLGEGVLAG